MKKKNITKYSTLFIILGIVLVFIVVVSTSYAFFTTTVKGKELVIKTGTLAVNYLKKTDVINLTNLYPMTNSEGLNQTPHEFSITNNGNITARYQIRLEIDNNDKNQIPLEYIKMSYKKGDNNYTTPVLLSDLNSSLVILKDVVINPQEVNNYGIKLWIDLSAPNDIQNKTFKAKVVVDSIQDVEDGYVINTIPIINLNKDKNNNIDINLKVGETYTELGVESVEDDTDILTVNQVVKIYEYFDGTNLTTVDKVDTSKTGIYYVTYSITDSNNNIGKSIRIVIVNNTSTIPTITLNGESTITLGERDYYKETGVTVKNNNKIITIGEVKTKVVGTYIVRYVVVDSNNNLNSVVRTVNVIKPYEELILNGTDPVLSDNLVPVKIQDDGTVKRASTLSEWYDYETKQWANAVVLKTPIEVIGEDNIHGANIKDDYASFDGADDYIDLGLENYDFGKNLTLAANFKLNTLQKNCIIGNWENAGGGIYYENGLLRGEIYIKELGSYVSVTTPFSDINNYHTVVLVFDGNVTKFYLDGKLVVEKNSAGNVNPSSVQFGIGVNIDSNGDIRNYSNINIKEYAIYNRVLSDDEISTNMNKNINIADATGLLSFGDFNNGFINNEVIPEEIIESYFVWIPKYSYQLWDLGNYSSLTTIDTTKPHAIPIKFGLTNTSDSNTGECTTPGIAGESGNCKVGDYMTHPAFLAFDTNGMWVGKFETGYKDATSTSEAETNTNKVDINKIIIKPNVYSWRNISIGNAFKNSYDYLRNDESHMMKNTEWGAIAYLSHSLYGTCEEENGEILCSEVRINNNRSHITGYAAIEQPVLGYNNGESIDGNRIEGTSLSTDGTYTVNYKNNKSILSSTTANYTGIYDLSGGAFECVIGYTTEANTIGGSSEITTIYDDFYTNSDYEKYYDKYTSTSYINRILGDATGEMGPFSNQVDPDENPRTKSSWYGDYAYFIYSSYPWFYRGGSWHHGSVAGVFAFHYNTGVANKYLSFRIVLTP